MRFIDAFVIILLFSGLFTGIFFLWRNLPTQSIEFQEYRARISQEFPNKSTQFYPNMRYPDKRISYLIEKNCSSLKRNNTLQAFQILQQKTILQFYESQNPQINVYCSQLPPDAKQKNHFVAGEGGPIDIINATKYAIVTSGAISLFRADNCKEPQIATHEILHALGFDHNSNSNSIMYPETKCDQTIDGDITKEINRLYSIPSLPDLEIESVQANKSGRYLGFSIQIANNGLGNLNTAYLTLTVDGVALPSKYNLDPFKIGDKRKLEVSNVRVPREVSSVEFSIDSTESELDSNNNHATLSLPPQ